MKILNIYLGRGYSFILSALPSSLDLACRLKSQEGKWLVKELETEVLSITMLKLEQVINCAS